MFKNVIHVSITSGFSFDLFSIQVSQPDNGALSIEGHAFKLFFIDLFSLNWKCMTYLSKFV